MAKRELDLGIPNVVWIGGDLYCKSRRSLAAAKRKLAAMGYEIKNLRKQGHSLLEGNTTIEKMEANGWSLWFVSLPMDIRKGKCGSCNGYISIRGIQCHGHTCELCGAVVYRDIVEDSTVRFSFRSDNADLMFAPELNMEVQRWDTGEQGTDGYLYLKNHFLGRGSFSVVTGDKAEAYLALHADKWELVVEVIDGKPVELYKIYYRNDFHANPADVIVMRDIWGHERNHKIVNVWDGVEYPEYSTDMPVPDSFSIFETWHWAPLDASPTLHQRLLGAIHNHDDKGWHHQDGSPWFSATSWEQIGLFVSHFTTLDADEWDRQSARFPIDGPGGIDAVAAFCHPLAQARNEPNIGNLVDFVSKVASGRSVTGSETKSALASLADRSTRPYLERLFAPQLPIEVMPRKIPRRIKKALGKPLSRRTPGEHRRVQDFLTKVR